MGCSKSVFIVDEYVLGHDDASLDLYKSLFLMEEDLLILQNAFGHIDIDNSQSIRMDEVMAYFGVDDSKFNRAVFGILSSDNRETITFLEYVVVMWNFLTIPVENISSFVFLLSPSNSPLLKPAEIISLFEMIHSKEMLRTVNMRKVIDEIKEMGHDDQRRLSVSQFATFIKTCNFMIAPIINMQVLLRENLIGKSFWVKQEAKRLASNQFKDIQNMLDLKTAVQTVQKVQMNRILNRDKIEREAEIRRRLRQETLDMEEKSMMAAGAKRARSSIIKLVQGGKKKKKDEGFSDLDESESPDSEFKLKSVKRQRTPTILMKHANLVRKEKREKKALKEEKARIELALAEGKKPTKKKGPGRFTIALKNKQAKRANKVSPE